MALHNNLPGRDQLLKRFMEQDHILDTLIYRPLFASPALHFTEPPVNTGNHEQKTEADRKAVAAGELPKRLARQIDRAFTEQARATLITKALAGPAQTVHDAVMVLVASIKSHRPPRNALPTLLMNCSLFGHDLEPFFLNSAETVTVYDPDLPRDEGALSALDAYYDAEDAANEAFGKAIAAFSTVLRSGKVADVVMAWPGAQDVINKALGVSSTDEVTQAITAVQAALTPAPANDGQGLFQPGAVDGSAREAQALQPAA